MVIFITICPKTPVGEHSIKLFRELHVSFCLYCMCCSINFKLLRHVFASSSYTIVNKYGYGNDIVVK